jgi:outer membrane protein TolC
VTQAGPGFSAPVFDLRLWEKWRASKENVSASTAQRAAAREQNAQLVVTQYLAGLRAEADVSAAKSRVELANALLNLAADQQKRTVSALASILCAPTCSIRTKSSAAAKPKHNGRSRCTD